MPPEKKGRLASVAGFGKGLLTKFQPKDKPEEIGTVQGHSGRYYQRGSDVEEQWLAAAIDDTEIVMAWMGVTSATPPKDFENPPGPKAAYRFLMTTADTALVAFNSSKKGEPPNVQIIQLPQVDLVVTDTVGRDVVTIGDWTWKTWLNNDGLYREFALLTGASPAWRRHEAARINWLFSESRNKRGEADELADVARTLLAGAESWGDGFSQLSAEVVDIVLEHEKDEEVMFARDQDRERLEKPLTAILDIDDAAIRFREWAEAWQLNAISQLGIVKALLDLEAPEERKVTVALPLHRIAREAYIEQEKKDLVLLSMMDLNFASHLIRVGEREEAREVLEERIDHLPDETLLDLLPMKGVDLTTRGSQIVKIRLLELLADARGDPKIPDVDAVTELSKLQPLIIERVDELKSHAKGFLRDRATALATVLRPGGLEASNGGEPPKIEFHPISSDLMETKLPHPASREGGAMSWLQENLGQVKAPDHSALRSYAERVTAKSHPHVLDMIADVTLSLGVSGLEAYISRGDMSVGIRAFEGSPPFLLIGADHLDQESDYWMKPEVLLYSIATEVAHLRFEHTRLTSSDVWDGVWHKGAQLLELVGVFAGPLGFIGGAVSGLGRLAVAQSVLSKAELVSTGAGKAVEFVGFAKGIQSAGTTDKGTPKDTEIGDRESEMLAACRLMQLTADRTGLTICGDLPASVEAIFLSSAEYRVELPLAHRHGLVKTLSRRDGDGELMNQALAIRLAALASFYLSSEYEELRNAVLGRSPNEA